VSKETILIRDLLQPFEELLGSRPEPELLTLTEKRGFMAQSDKYNKRVAREDTSSYKVIHKNDIAFNPYLLWAGAIAQNVKWETGLISPLYPTFHIHDGYDPRFVDYLLGGEPLRLRYDTISFGSVPRKRRASVTDFLNLEIPKPPSLAEQRRIAEVLDKAEALRAKRRAALAQLDSLTQSLFLDLFGDPATNPKGFEIGRIRDLLESASYGTSEKSGPHGKYAVLRMNNITRSGEMDFTDLKFMDLEECLHERYLVRAGDILFNRTNSAELVGKTGIIRGTKPMAYAGYLIRLRVNADNDPEFLWGFLNSKYSKLMLRGMCKSIIGMANINATEIQAMKVPLPPLDLQRKFARRITAVEKLKTAQRAALAELDALFASLQHRAFRGEL
jgi:type I restriction enzyme S subunit